MRPLLLDTNAYSAFRRGKPDILEILQIAEEIILSPPVKVVPVEVEVDYSILDLAPRRT